MTEQASRLIALLNQNDPSAYEEIRNALAKSQISPDAADDNGATLLLGALRRRQEDIAQLLLDEGANPFIISKYGQSAAGFMAQSGNEVWKQIIGDWGEAFSGSDVKGEAWPVLQGACRAAALGECKELPQKLLKEDRDAWGHTALMLAVMHGQAAAAEALLKAGADPQAPQTLLGLPMIRFMNAAVPLQHPDLTTAMRTAYAGLFPNGLPAQSDDDAISSDQLASIASMHHLVRRGNVNRIRRLLELGVNPALRNSKGLTVLQIAEQTREAEAEKLIRQWNGSASPADDEPNAEADPVPPQASEVPQSGQKKNYPVRRLQELNAQKLIEEGDVPGLQILLSRGGTPDSVMSNKASMLVHACRTNRESFLFLLLAGASPVLKDSNGDSAEEAARGSELRSSYIRQFSTCGKKNSRGSTSDLISAVLAEDLSTAAMLAASNPELINEALQGF